MKVFSKVTQSRPAALQDAIYRHVDERMGDMTQKLKAVGCGDTQTAKQNIFRLNSTQLIVRLKAVSFRAAAWLSIVGGSSC